MSIVYNFRVARKTGQVSLTVPAFIMRDTFKDAFGLVFENREDELGKYVIIRPVSAKRD